MNREELKALGLTDDQIDKVMASHGKAVNSFKEKAEKVDGLESQLSDYKTQLADRDKQLDDLSKQVKDNEDLTTEINRLKEENKTATADLQKKLDTQAFDFALDKALTGAKVKNAKAIRGLLDMDTIKLDGETLKGFDDQIAKLKESDSYLFDVEQQQEEPPKPSFTTGQHQTSGTGNNDPFAAKLAKYN